MLPEYMRSPALRRYIELSVRRMTLLEKDGNATEINELSDRIENIYDSMTAAEQVAAGEWEQKTIGDNDEVF